MANAATATDWHAKIDPQQAAALRRNAEIVESLGGPGEGIAEIRERAEAARARWNEGGPRMAVQRDLSAPGPFRDVPMRLYKAADGANPPLFCFLHGGGFRIGSALSNDRQMRELAERWGGAVISSDYVHAPEHCFPDPVVEISAVLEWLARNGAAWGIDPGAIVVGGASAGASVAFGAAFELRARRPDLLKGVVSLYGVLDDNLESGSMRALGGGDFFLQRDYVAQVYEGYLGDGDRNDPRAFAVKGALDGLPPVFLAAAELDPIRDDSLALAERLAAAGQPHRLHVYPGVMHAFFNYSSVIDSARACIADMADFLRETVGP